MSQHNRGLSSFVNRLTAMFKATSQRKSARSSVTLSEALETRQLMAADLQKVLYDTTMLDNANGGNQTSDSYFVAFNAPKDIQQLKTVTGAVSVEPFALIPNSYTFTYSSPKTFQEAADQFEALSQLNYVYPNLPLTRNARLIPDDTLFPNQWHLRNTGQTGGTVGADANVTGVWDTYRGNGVVVGVVDDGLQITHPDLVANMAAGLHLDLVGGDADPTPAATDAHGTAVGGVIAAVGNNGLGVAGAAFGANLAGIRLLGANQTAVSEAQALGHAIQSIDISNNSWGPADVPIIAALPPQVAAALEAGAENGRGGLGVVYTWAGGNGRGGGDYSNYDQYASSRFVIGVGAITDRGRQSSYSESGANLLISAYSNDPGIVTTDLTGNDGYNSSSADGDPLPTDYTGTFGGTSSAAPLVAGVVALMLEANPNLSYRDVMDILARSARRNDPTDFGWQRNGAGLWVNHKYGFGAIDAQAAVTRALTHTNLGPLREERTGAIPVNLVVPDNSFPGVSIPVVSSSQLSLEHVELVFNATHQNRGDFRVTLVSPDGTRSIMALSRTADSGANYTNWVFTSARHRGEESSGTWVVEVQDLVNGVTGTIDSVELIFYGTELPLVISASPSSFFEDAGNGAATGTVSRSASSNLLVPLTVTLASSDPTEATVPATVTIPAGRRSATFAINAVDDTLLDGTQNVQITAAITGYSTAVDLTVLDKEGVTIVVDPTAVNENDGANAATVTVSRSNTDTSAPSPIVLINNQIRRYSKTGTLLSSVTIPWPAGPRPGGEDAHDVAIMESGLIAVFNGTTQAYLSVYNPGTLSWNHIFVQDLSASTSDRSNGGLTTSGNFVFLSDTETTSGNQFGLVRVNVVTGEILRFGTRSFGNRLFASTWPESDLYEISPADGSVLRQIPIPTSTGGDAGLAFDGTNLWYINRGGSSLFKVNPDSGAILDTISLSSGYDGLAWLKGKLYLLDSFIDNKIAVFDPTTRAIERVINVDDINRVTFGVTLNISGGLVANPNSGVNGSLLVTDTFSSNVWELDAGTGVLRNNGNPLFQTGSSQDDGLAVVGNEIYVGNGGGNFPDMKVFSLGGAFLRTVTQSVSWFGLDSLGGDSIPGLVPTSLRYRDTNLGQDGKLYALDNAGQTVGVFDPATLEVINFFDLASSVKTIAVSANGNIYGGDDFGDVKEFSPTGALLRTVASGLSSLIDIEINVSGRMLLSSTFGEIAESTTSLASFNSFSTVVTPAFVSFGEHVSRNTAELVVTLTNSDTTEVLIPLTVVIPEGQQSVTFPLTAVDDNMLDGLQLVTLTASASGYDSASESVGVVDVETLAVDVLATSIAESQGNAATRVKVSRTDIDGPFTFNDVQSYSNSNPVNLLDTGVVTSVINVPSQISRVTDVDVTLSLTHNWMQDLDVFLIAPSGKRVELFTDLNTNSKSLVNTILDDQGGSSILAGSGAFTARYMPEEALSKLVNENVAGNWTLEITDDNVGDVGVLSSWSITLSTAGLSPATVTVQTSAADEALPIGQTTVQVVIPANQSEVFVDLNAIDDSLLDGPQIVNITAIAADVTGYSLGTDQVIVTDDEKLTFTVSRPSVSEAAGIGALTGTLTRFNSDISLPFTIAVSSSDMSELTVPATVTIPANATSVTFPIDAVDDNAIDGTQQVTITASAPLYGGDLTALVSVDDLEPSLVLASSGSTVREDSGTLEITLTRIDQADISQAMIVSLASVNVPAGGVSTLSVPPTVTIPANSVSVTFFATVIDDALLDGTQTGKITASSVGLISGDVLVDVTDHETITVSINKTEFLENAGARAAVGTVTRSNTNTSLALTVNLTSGDTTELTVPVSVTIPAGAASATFDIAAINDPDLDGPQTIQVNAAAAGYFGTAASVVVLDHEPPVVTSPTVKTVNPLPTINWNAIPGAIRYDVQVANLSSGANVLIFRTVNETSLTPFEKLGIGRYRVWVRAIDSLERPGFWSAPRDFTIETAPTITAPVLTGATANTTFPEISWTAVTDAVRYELWVNNVTTGTARVISRNNITTSSYKATEALGSGTYRAYVRAFNASSENGLWSAPHTFTVLATPGIVQPTTGGTFDRTPTFTWNRIAGATNYDLYVTSRTLNRIVIRDQNVRATAFTPATDMAIGEYTVWVRAQSGQYFSPWSAARHFSIGLPPVISSPANGPSATARPTFLWSSMSGTERYELWVTNVQTNTRAIYRTDLTSTSFTPTANLAAGSYRVWVRAVSFMGETTAWSTPVSFTVAAVESPASELSDANGEMMLTVLPSSEKARPKTTRPAQPDVTEQTSVTVQNAYAPVVVARQAVTIASKSEAEAFDSVMETWAISEWWTPAAAADAKDPRRQKQVAKVDMQSRG